MPPPRSAASNGPPTLDEWRELLGRKVTVRYRLYDDPKYPESELVGVVQSVAGPDEGHVAIIDRHGRIHEVPVHAILVAKVFPV